MESELIDNAYYALRIARRKLNDLIDETQDLLIHTVELQKTLRSISYSLELAEDDE